MVKFLVYAKITITKKHMKAKAIYRVSSLIAVQKLILEPLALEVLFVLQKCFKYCSYIKIRLRERNDSFDEVTITTSLLQIIEHLSFAVAKYGFSASLPTKMKVIYDDYFSADGFCRNAQSILERFKILFRIKTYLAEV